MEYKLRDYQISCVKAILTRLQEWVRLQAIVMGTGTGKTLCFSQLPPIVKAKWKKTLVLAHREELLEQAKEKIEAVTPELRVEIEQWENHASPDADVIVASVATLWRKWSERIKKFDPDSIGLLIVDECFVSWTKIDWIDIENIKIWDMVRSYNTNTWCVEYKKVLALFKKRAYKLIKIKTNNREFICTLNHPVYCNKLWIEASKLKVWDFLYINDTKDEWEKELYKKENMCSMLNWVSTKVLEFDYDTNMFRNMQKSKEGWEKKKSSNGLFSMLKMSWGFLTRAISNSKKMKSLLFWRMQSIIQKKGIIWYNEKNKYKTNTNKFWEDENREPNEQYFDKTKSKWYIEKNMTQTFSTMMKLKTYATYSKNIIRKALTRNRICSKDRPFLRWVSNLLQNWYSKSRNYDLNRSWLKQSQCNDKKTTGWEKNSIFTMERVESIEIYKQASSKWFRKLCKDGYVYNIEVEDNNNYFANDTLVHNCHHSTWSSYLNVLSYFWANKEEWLKEWHPVVLWFTATPNRADNQWLDKVFDEVVFKYDMRDAIEDWYLARIKAYTVNTNESLDWISIRAGDFAIGELSKTVNTPERNKLILESYKTICDYEKAIVFAVDVNHAIELSKMFKDDWYNSEVVTGETPKDERKQIIKDFKDGKIHVLSNVGVFIEGFDEPSTKAILLARPTKSAGLYIQQIGRGSRLSPWKTEVKIIDFVDNMTKNSIISSSSLIGLDKPIKANWHDLMDLKEKYEELLANKPNADIRNIEIDDIDRLITEVDIFKLAQTPEVVKNSSSYSWISYLEWFRLNLGKLDDWSSLWCDIRENAIGQRDVIFYKNIKVDPCFKNWFKKSVFQKEHSFSVRDRITALEEADRYIYKNYKERIYLVDQYSSWRSGGASVKQVALLKKFWHANADQLSKWEAANLLNKIFAEKNSKK